MNIRMADATTADASAIIAFMNRVGGESDNLTFGKDEFFIQDAPEEAKLIKRQQNQGGFVLLAWADISRKKGGPQLVGLLSVDRGTRTRLRHRGTLMLSVLKEYWHQGVGTRLLQQGVARAESDQTLDVLALEVRSDNAHAIRLYERFGFERTGTNRGLLKIADTLYDTHLMSRVFHRAEPTADQPLFYLDEVVDAISEASDDLVWYACLDTGEVACSFADDSYDWDDGEQEDGGFDPETAEGRWVNLPDRYDRNDMRCMRRFAQLQDEQTCQRLLDLTHRRGAYRSFKDECARRGLLNDYFAFQERSHRQLAIAWLETHGCLWTEGMRPYGGLGK